MRKISYLLIGFLLGLPLAATAAIQSVNLSSTNTGLTSDATTGQVLLGQGGQPLFKTLSGDVASVTGAGAVTLSKAPFFAVLKMSVNLNATGNSDLGSVSLSGLNGCRAWQPFQIFVDNPSTTMSTATFQFWTAASAGGTSLSSLTTVSIGSTSDGTAGNTMAITPTPGTTQTFSVAGFPSIFAHLTTPQGGAATADFDIVVRCLP